MSWGRRFLREYPFTKGCILGIVIGVYWSNIKIGLNYLNNLLASSVIELIFKLALAGLVLVILFMLIYVIKLNRENARAKHE